MSFLILYIQVFDLDVFVEFEIVFYILMIVMMMIIRYR